MTSENTERLEHILNQLTYRYAPERGITAHYIAVCLNAYGVKAPPVKPTNQHVVTRHTADWYVCTCGQTGSEQWALRHEYPSRQASNHT